MLIAPRGGVPGKVKVLIYATVPSYWDENIAKHEEELGSHFEVACSVLPLDVLSVSFWAACPREVR